MSSPSDDQQSGEPERNAPSSTQEIPLVQPTGATAAFSQDLPFRPFPVFSLPFFALASAVTGDLDLLAKATEPPRPRPGTILPSAMRCDLTFW